MRISLSITDFASPAPLADRLTEIARAADAGGIDTLWVADHLLQSDPHSDPDGPMLEAYTTLAFLAARTRRVRLGTLVTAVTFRPPALLVKAVTTLDVLSGGRAWLGLGAGYAEEEARTMGMPLPPVAERFDVLEETLRLAGQMWSGPFFPAPLTQPRPPILVGGMGERKTLRLVAQYADACNLFDIPDGGETIRRKLDVLAAHCERFGRDPASVETTVSSRIAPGETAEQLAERCARLGHVILVGRWDDDALQVACEAAQVGASTS